MGFDEVKDEAAARAEASINDITRPDDADEEALLLNRWVVVAEYVGSDGKALVVSSSSEMAAYDIEGMLRGGVRQVWDDEEEEDDDDEEV